MKAINIENVLNFNFIDQPDIENRKLKWIKNTFKV